MAVVGVIILVMCVLLLALLIRKISSSKKVAELLDLGNKYLIEQDYEQAIVTFQEVISIEPKCEEAYLGLADVYVAMGNYNRAFDTLQKGYEQTGAERISNKIVEVRRGVEEVKIRQEEDKVLKGETLYEGTKDVWVDFSWNLTDFGVLGFNILDSNWEEVKNGILWDHELGGILHSQYDLEGNHVSMGSGESVSVSGEFPSTVSGDYFFNASYINYELRTQLIWRKEGYRQFFLQSLNGMPFKPYSCPVAPRISYEEGIEFAEISEIENDTEENTFAYEKTNEDIIRINKTASCKFGSYKYTEDRWETGGCYSAQMIFIWDNSQNMDESYRERQPYIFHILAIFGEDNLVSDIKVTLHFR